ncbi:hypothetical protein H8M03_10240 [Sphingomonas sabuli]|uniref:Peptidase M1 membrane alanine aminopeptidase domain-containing protein n=1 Tax=Sphingomonas sabuli TaxID=2764186 RepID=A0A7G9L185_9SPHN|nr:hypothetical protein [Sphingomonas sabuli]QNM82384.1 hypothetical protein H8M03_10240 [Sphingomonas sabuli]
MRLALALAALAIASPAVAQRDPVASATVQRSGDSWTADYVLGEDAPVWLFAKSVLPRGSKTSWRLGTVRVLTPGVRLERIGDYDALVAQSGSVPRKVRLSFTPFFEDIEAGYDAAMAFGDGSVALYTSQFKLLPVASRAVAAAAPTDPDQIEGAGRPTHIEIRDAAGDVFFMGERTDAAIVDDYDAYVLFGDARPQVGEAMATIIDPKLPQWLHDFILSELPPVLERYRQQLGPAPVGRPMLMVSWGGATKEGSSFGGSVLPATVVMTIGGQQTLTADKGVSNYARWLVSHEAAHFWLGQAVRYSSPAVSWITEGGAELLAFRAAAAVDRTYDVKARLTRARRECEPFLANGGVEGAYRRPDDFRAYYACGVVIALAAEQASGGDFSTFVKTLIDRNRDDGVVTRAEWLALLEQKAPRRGLPAAVAELLDKPHADGAAALDRFIAAAGIADRFAPQ